MSPPHNRADECTNFPDCSSNCEACEWALKHPLEDPQVQAEEAVAGAFRDMRCTSGEAAGEDASDDAYAFIASLKRRGFTVTPAKASGAC